MRKYCNWCEGKIPEELKLCSGCLLLSSEFIGTDIRPFLSEKRNKETNNYLKPGRGLTTEQRIKHLTQEIEIPASSLPILRSKRRNSTAHWMYNSEEWDELVDYWRRFGYLRPGNYWFPDGSPLSVESNQKIFINGFDASNLPILDIAEWLSNPLRINAIKEWGDFMLLLDCILTTLPNIVNEEAWAVWIKENSWRGIDNPFKDVRGHGITLGERMPPFLEFIGRKYREEGDDRTVSDVMRGHITEMAIHGEIGRAWAEMYFDENKKDFFDEYRKKNVPVLVTHNHRLKLLVIDGKKPATCQVGNDPRDWRKLMTWAILPSGSEGSEFVQGLFMNWTTEYCLWEPSLRQIRSARLLHDEIENLDKKSSLIPIDYSEENSGILVVGNSGTSYVISTWEMKLKVDAIPSIDDKDRAQSLGIDLCIDPLTSEDLPFGDIAVGYLLALHNDENSRNQIFTLDFFLQALDETVGILGEEKYWKTVEENYELLLESMHEIQGLEMDEEMENRIAEFENEQEMLRQQIEIEAQAEADLEATEISIDEIRFQSFLERLEESSHGDYYE
jgi:hypothetical protein|tara:strand:+ start:1199 stop:2878 length:1680 start_codon:yes stop_codon:yes gene_type:complete